MNKPILRKTRHLKGTRVLTAIGDGYLVAKGRDLFITDSVFQSFRFLARLPLPTGKRLLCLCRIFRRILRLDPTVALAIDDKTALVYAGNDIWFLDTVTGALTLEIALPQRKALNITRVEGIAGIDDGFYFGEYWYNTSRKAVGVWHRPLHKAEWRKVYDFPAGEIDHVHEIVADPYRACLWVLTGDYDKGSCLWQARDRFQNVTPILRGEQKYRAVWMLPCPNELVYATDSNISENTLFRLSDVSGQWQVEPIASLPGSCIYAQISADGALFSTTVEPGQPKGGIFDLFEYKLGCGIRDRNAYIYFYAPESGLVEVLRARKDLWPMRLCQFGTFQFARASQKGKFHAIGAAVAGYDGDTLEFCLDY